jgi:very-short-patch-repair endonuclease
MHPQEQYFARLRAAHLAEVRRALERHAGHCVASHESAAILYGLPVFAIPAKAQLTRIEGHRRNGRVRAVAAALQRQDVCVVDGVPVTSMPRAVIDIARARRFAAALVTADACLRRGVPRSELIRVVAAMGRWPGVKNARRVIECADPRAEAASESITRGRILRLGLEVPDLQVVITEVPGGYRVDFYWERHRLIGEVDGMVKYDDPGVLAAEKVRQEGLEERYACIRWTYAQAVRSSDEAFTARLTAAFARGDRLRRLLGA